MIAPVSPERYPLLARRLASSAMAGLAWAVTGLRAIHLAPETGPAPQRVYFANHASHGDFILLSASLPPEERLRTRAAAAADYWGATPARRLIAGLLGCLLIERGGVEGRPDPLAAMLGALDAGQSLILFPEGTRNTGETPLQRFRSGLYNLAAARPGVELVPVWIENMGRVLPKGHVLPVPLLCRVVFGAPERLSEGEERRAFLDRMEAALLRLDPEDARQRLRHA